jgi:hypothetical protein
MHLGSLARRQLPARAGCGRPATSVGSLLQARLHVGVEAACALERREQTAEHHGRGLRKAALDSRHSNTGS